MRLNKVLFIIMFAATTAQLRAQSHSVDPLTGAFTTGVPLFTISDGDVSVPIDLVYHTNGISVNSASGLYGHGWSLSADAGISRDVRSLPDDYLGQSTDTRKGWLHGDMGTRIKNFTINTDNDPESCGDETSNYTFLDSFGYNEDTEPDVFYVNAPGLSFQFYFDENKNPQVVPYVDVQITKSTDSGSGQINSFTVVDARGYTYTFAAKETTTEWIKEGYDLKDYALRRKYELYKTACTYATSWKLTQITSPIYGQIDFTYTDVALRSDPTLTINQGVSVSVAQVEDRYIFKSPASFENFHGNKDKVFEYDLVYNQKVLDLITSPTHTVDFETLTKFDNSVVIKSIKLYDNRTLTPTLVKEYSLSYMGPQYFVYTGHSMPVPWDPGNILVGTRSFLSSIQEKTATSSMPPVSLEYYGTSLPSGSAEEKDDWGYFASKDYSQWESLIMGSLKRINYPTGGYTVIFYQPHDYFDVGTSATRKVGGIRVKKTISHDGISSSSDVTEEYEYLKTNGQSSGKLVYSPSYQLSTVRLNHFSYAVPGSGTINIAEPRYQDIQVLVNNSTIPSPTQQYFNLKSKHSPGDYELIGGSVMAYERVVRKMVGAGRSIYEYDLPAMAGDLTANNSEWQASKTELARPATGVGDCFERGAIPTGAYAYPYPRNPNYSFARGLLSKVTDENEAGIKVREVSFTYQRVYGDGVGIRKLYGLAMEELPTSHYYNSDYINAKLFLYSKYEIFTDVKIELDEKKETFYYSTDLTNKNEITTSYEYGSSEHRELTEITTTNSDLATSITKLKYVEDYVISSPSGTNASNIVKLKDAHRNEIVESLASVVSGSNEKYIAGSIFLFQDIANKIYPYQAYAFNSTEGLSSFTPSGVTSGTTFHFDETNYDLKSTITGFSSTAVPTEVVGKSRIVQSTVLGYGETLPVMQVSNARLEEVGFADFEGTNQADFSGWSSATKVTGRTGLHAIEMPGSYALTISRTITNQSAKQYSFSCWVKTSSSGNLTVKFQNGGADIITPVQIAVTGTGEWKYVAATADASTFPSSLTVELSSSVSVELDEVAVYPAHAQVAFSSYELPFGVEAATSMTGQSILYSYDEWGRVITVRDQDLNILSKRNYHVRP